MGATTKSPGERVAHYRREYGDITFDIVDANAARDAALRATVEPALEAIEQGDPAEAVAWATLGQLLSFKYRRLAR